MSLAEYPVSIGPSGLAGTVRLPPHPRGLVIFAHGSGSSRFSPRNLHVAHGLGGQGLATLLFDLLSDEEAESRGNVFDVRLLAGRLEEAIVDAGADETLRSLPIGLFGASTGAAAALVAATRVGERVGCVVSRGGRPDLAGAALAQVRAPTLLIVGALDPVVLELNRGALRHLPAPSALEVVAGASHLFAEDGTLDIAAGLAAAWFLRFLSPPGAG